jgi:hypothetical protein
VNDTEDIEIYGKLDDASLSKFSAMLGANDHPSLRDMSTLARFSCVST